MRKRAALLLVLVACSGETSEELRLAASDLGEGRVGESYRATITANRTVEWDVRGVPDGLVVTTDGASAELAGVPVESGTFEIDVTVAAGEATTGRVYVLVVREGALAITTEALPEADVMMPYSATVEAAGGRGMRTWTVEGLPEGLTATRDEAVTIAGTLENPGTFDVRVAVRDVGEGTDERTFTLRVRASELSITTTALPVAFVGVNYAVAIESAGGRAPYQWTITEGPEDFTLDAGTTSTTSLVGTTASTGRYAVTVQVEDAEGERATATFDLDVTDGPLTVLTSTLTDAQLGVAYGTTLGARGGVGTVRWSITNGGLPDGVSFDTSLGRVQGTPTVLGRRDFTAQVMDERGRTASQRLTLFVSDEPPLVLTTLDLPSVEVGLPVELPIAASGGSTPYTWSVDGTLPTGLAVDDIGTPNTFVRGVPTRLEREDVEVTVFDRNGRRASRVFTLEVTPSTVPLQIDTTQAPDGETCRDYLFMLAGSGGSRTDYTWTLAQGSLPAGLTFDPVDAVVIGVPEATGSFPMVFALEDGVGEQTSVAMTIEVATSGRPRFGLASTFGATHRLLFPIDLCTSTFVQGLPINQPLPDDDGVSLYTPIVFSPSGDRAAYVAEEGGEERVFVVDLSGAAPARTAVSGPLFNTIGSARISWSPTGQHIAYVAAPEPNRYAAFVADVSNPQSPGAPVQVSVDRPGGNVTTEVVWAPDGQRFAFVGDPRIDETFELFVGNVQSSTVASPASGVIAQGQGVRGYPPVWARDGTHVLFSAVLRDTRIEVFAVEVGVPNATPFPIAPNAPSYTASYTPYFVAPNRERFVYVATQEAPGAWEMYLVELRSPPFTPVRLGHALVAGESINKLKWSEDSEKVLYIVPESGISAGALYVAEAASPATSIRIDAPASSGARVTNQDWAFDFDSTGDRVAYLESDVMTGQSDPYFVDLSSGTPTTPVRLGPPARGRTTVGFSWARDAPRVALMTHGNSTVGIGEMLVVDVSNGAPGLSRLIGANLNAPPVGDITRVHLRSAGAVLYFSAGSGGGARPLFGAFTAGAARDGALLANGTASLNTLFLPR